MRQFWMALPCIVMSVACAPELGDGCDTNVDCSVTGERDCDTTQPGGYCTIAGCTANSCGDEGRCVRFNPDEPRLVADWCMRKCSDNGDCDRDAYRCASTEQLKQEADGKEIAEVLDSKGGKFCVVKNRD